MSSGCGNPEEGQSEGRSTDCERSDPVPHACDSDRQVILLDGDKGERLSMPLDAVIYSRIVAECHTEEITVLTNVQRTHLDGIVFRAYLVKAGHNCTEDDSLSGFEKSSPTIFLDDLGHRGHRQMC